MNIQKVETLKAINKIKQQKIIIEGLEDLLNNYRYYLIVDNKPIVESKECTNKFIELEKTLEAYHKLDDYEKHTLFINNKENK